MAGHTDPELTARLRSLPAVHLLLADDTAKALEASHGHQAVAEAARGLIAIARQAVLEGGPAPAAAELVARLPAAVEAKARPHIRRVINATGVVLHTNLGRAPLPRAAIEAILAASGACNLELDLETGQRGSRQAGVSPSSPDFWARRRAPLSTIAPPPR